MWKMIPMEMILPYFLLVGNYLNANWDPTWTVKLLVRNLAPGCPFSVSLGERYDDDDHGYAADYVPIFD
jgi:hypothetical protein